MTEGGVVMAFRVLRRLAGDDPDGCGKPQRRVQSTTPEEVSAVKSLLKLPWWTRIWMVQESVLPKRPILTCGTMQIPLKYLLQTSNNYEKLYTRHCCGNRLEELLHILWRTIYPMAYVRECKDVHVASTLFANSLHMFRYREASDPRDRVFALLGLGATITADYSLSCDEVIIDSVRQCIVESRELCFLRRIQEKNRRYGLPTWVSDWCAEAIGDFEDSANWLEIYYKYDAAGGVLATIEDTSSNSVLSLRGYMLDRIFGVGGHFESRGEMDAVAEWKNMMAESPHCPYEQGYDEPFW